MARISNGIHGGFSGTVGTVVGGSWNGIDYMRGKATPATSEPSTAQKVQRAKFAVAAKFTQSMKDLLTIGFRDFAIRMTGHNRALSFTMKNAVFGSYPDFKIDYSQVLVTRGDIPNAGTPSVTSTSPGVVSFSWKDNSGVGYAHPNDSAVLVAYCEPMNQTKYTIGNALRGSGSGTLHVPSFNGREVQTWLAFVGHTDKEIATSIYTGAILVDGSESMPEAHQKFVG